MSGSSTKKICFLAATPGETRVLKDIYAQDIPNRYTVDFFTSGIGMLQTSMSLTHTLALTDYDMIVHIGVCGYIDSPLPMIQIARTVNIHTQKELCVPQYIPYAPRVSIACSERPVYDACDIKEETYVDMESYAVEQVGEYFQIPRIILKIPYDKIGQETKDFDYQQACHYMKRILGRIDIYTPLISRLGSTPRYTKDEALDMLFHRYRCTVSETIICTKLFHTYCSLSSDSFFDFYKTHQHLDKKKFLQQLEQTCYDLTQLT